MTNLVSKYVRNPEDLHEKSPDCRGVCTRVYDATQVDIEIERLYRLAKASERFFNAVCFRWPGAVEQIEEVAGPLREALKSNANEPSDQVPDNRSNR